MYINDYKDDESVNPSLLWEMIKLKVHEKPLCYSKIKTKQTKQHELSVEQTIARLQEELDNINTDDTLPSHLEEKLNEGRLDVAPLTASVERREVTSQTTCRDELNNKIHKSVKLGRG